jgi:peroxisomal 3,2-trans-enoyl-CoA isomerase
MGKRLGAQELAATGFVNKVFPQSSADVFIKSVLEYLRDTFEDLDTEACLITKNLIKASLPDGDAANIRELFAGADRFASGKPQIEFAKYVFPLSCNDELLMGVRR